MTDIYKSDLEANQWIINMRWYYLSALLCLSLVLGYRYFLNFQPFDILDNPVFVTLLIPFLINFLFYIYLLSLKRQAVYRGVGLLSCLQVFFELVIITCLTLALDGVLNIGAILFLLPIVESIVLFRVSGSVVVAGISGLIITFSALIKSSNFINYISNSEPRLILDQKVAFLNFYQAIIVFIAYLVLGFLSAYISHIIRGSSRKLKDDMAVNEIQINELKIMNKELEAKARELSSKDMELTLANKRLESLEQAKSKFVSVTTHQLRTPLSGIKWTFEMMENGSLGPVSDEQKEFLTKGHESTKRMISIVNDLLNMDRVEEEKIDYIYKPASVLSLIDSILSEFTNQTESKKMNIEVVKPDRPFPEVEMDAMRIKMVLENLIDNAIKYSLEGGKVVVTASDAGINSVQNNIEITITDSGIGVPKEEQPKIFHQFFRASNAIQKEPDGSGIGLYIAKDIIEKHGGTIWFDSLATGGMSFHFTLPIHQKKL